MSLRKIAKELGITPAYLSMMVNGKRPWREDLYERYCELVNSVNSNNPSVNSFRPSVQARSLVAHLHGVQGIAGSIPVSPTLDIPLRQGYIGKMRRILGLRTDRYNASSLDSHLIKHLQTPQSVGSEIQRHPA